MADIILPLHEPEFAGIDTIGHFGILPLHEPEFAGIDTIGQAVSLDLKGKGVESDICNHLQ